MAKAILKKLRTKSQRMSKEGESLSNKTGRSDYFILSTPSLPSSQARRQQADSRQAGTKFLHRHQPASSYNIQLGMASSCSSHSVNLITSPSTKLVKASVFPTLNLPIKDQEQRKLYKLIISRRHHVICSAVQESSSTSTVAAEAKEESNVKPKPKAAAKTPPKPLPEMMQEDVIPSLRAILEEAQNDLSEIELSFNDNRLQGSFQKNGIPYSFWGFFPNGVLTGPKGFSLSSHGAEVSTVEPFLIDEKKITSKHVVFWVEKRLAAQGILPVWKE